MATESLPSQTGIVFDLSKFDLPQKKIGSISDDKMLLAIGVVIGLFVSMSSGNLYLRIVFAIISSFCISYSAPTTLAIIYSTFLVLTLAFTFSRRSSPRCINPSPSPPDPQCPSNDPALTSGGCQENFYTLFTPFSREEKYAETAKTVALSTDATRLLPMHKKLIRLGGLDADANFMRMVSMLLLSRSKILNIKLVWDKMPDQYVRDVADSTLDLAMVPSPAVNRFMREKKQTLESTNLRFVSNIAHYYIFCISSIKSGVQNIHQLAGRRVGVVSEMIDTWRDFEPAIFEGRKPKEVRMGSEMEMFNALKFHEVDAFFWAGTYPNPFLDGVILAEITHSYQLIPVMLQDEKAFAQNNMPYFKANLDISNKFLPSRYLPTGLGRIWMNNYMANYWTFGYDLALICNTNLPKTVGYDIARTIFNGRGLIMRNRNRGRETAIRFNEYNREWFNQDKPLTPADIARPSLPDVPIQDGVREFFLSKGMISTCQEPGCMKYIGTERCNLCDPGVRKIDRRKTEMQWRETLMEEKSIPSHFVGVPFRKVWDREYDSLLPQD